MTFEEKLSALETLVSQMEDGGQTLQQSLESYERGIALSRELSAELDAAEKKMLELKGGRSEPMEDAP